MGRIRGRTGLQAPAGPTTGASVSSLNNEAGNICRPQIQQTQTWILPLARRPQQQQHISLRGHRVKKRIKLLNLFIVNSLESGSAHLILFMFETLDRKRCNLSKSQQHRFNLSKTEKFQFSMNSDPALVLFLAMMGVGHRPSR